MTFLAWVLVVKIAVSLVALVWPFLFWSPEQIFDVTGIETGAALARFYGVAILALLTGYGFGLAEHLSGKVPTGVLAMGTVSNGGGAGLAIWHLDGVAQAMAVAFFGSIALALVAVLAIPGRLARTGGF